MGDVTHLTIVPGDGYHAEADTILETAKGQLIDCVLVGRDQSGALHLAHTGGSSDSIYLLALAQHTILNCDVED